MQGLTTTAVVYPARAMTWPMPVISVATPAPSPVLSLNVAGSVFSTLTCSGSRPEMKLERVGEQHE